MAFEVSDGHQLWSWHDEKTRPYVGGAVASRGVVVVATGTAVGTAPAAVYPVVNHLVGLDAATGRELWRRPIGHDGQAIPAVFAGSHLVVSLADGTVLGLDPTTGSTAWSDPAPTSCRLDPPEAVNVNAAVVTGGARATLEYQCVTAGDQINPADGMITQVDPATGVTEWRWRPGRWDLQYQSTVASSNGVTTMIGTPVTRSGNPISGISDFEWDLGPAGYQTYDLVGVDQSDGRPLWTLSGVPVDAAVYAGRSQLCVVSQYGVSCRAARSGAELWEWRPAVVSTFGPVQGRANLEAAAGGSLYLVEPTPAAGRIDTQSTTQRSAPGTFRLVAMTMASGAVTLSIPLPAFYHGPTGVVVSPMVPPAVEAVSHGMALVSPQVQETDVTEAFELG